MIITEKYKNFIWDFDGTLFDSYPHTAQALALALKDSGREIDIKEAEKLLRITVGTAVRHYELTEQERAAFNKYELTDELEPVIKIYDGVLDAFKRILSRGGRHFLFTHRDKKALQLLGKHGMLGLFTEVITVENGFPYKPAPDAIEYLVKEHSLNKDETVMVGDREIDIGSGVNAGVHTLFFDEFSASPKTQAEEIYTSFEQIG